MIDADLRCSVQTRSQGGDPIGSMGVISAFVLVEWPLPWPADIATIPELAAPIESLRSVGIRVQAVTTGGSPPERRVTVHRPRAPLAEMSLEWAVPEERLAEHVRMVATALVDGSELPAGGRSSAARDVLVCTHGRRDRCCGSLGTALWAELREVFAGRADVRLLRTSHMGGHRFAPTLLMLPDGTGWAYADVDLARRVVDRLGAVDDVVGRMRGSPALGPPELQALERVALEQIGWSLFDAERRGARCDDGRYELIVRGRGGFRTTFTAEVRPARRVVIPTCGSPPTGTEKQATEFEVGDLEVRCDRTPPDREFHQCLTEEM